MDITNSNSTRVLETIINIMITVQLEDSQEGKSTKQIQFLHYQEDLHSHHVEIQFALDIQTPLTGTNAVPALHHLRNLEMYLEVFN